MLSLARFSSPSLISLISLLARRLAVSIGALVVLPSTAAFSPRALAQSGVAVSGISLSTSRTWILLADGLQPAPAPLEVRVTLPAGTIPADYSVSLGGQVTALTRVRSGPSSGRSGTGNFLVRMNVADLPVGEHAVALVHRPSAMPGRNSARIVARSQVKVSYPLHVAISADWDDTRFGDPELANMELLRTRHTEMRVTQFYAPYNATDPEITDERRAFFQSYIQQKQAQGDEIGVHIHGWCHWVSTTKVPCNTRDSFYRDDGSGYTTNLDEAYSEDEMVTLLAAAARQLMADGLGRPTSFRAGGWTAGLPLLRALVRTGYTVDSSAVPPHRLAQWKGEALWTWNIENWTGITETSQPYAPSNSDITRTGSDALALLEIPDNGVLADYMTTQDMIGVYTLNAGKKGSTLSKPTLVQFGYHPPNLDAHFFARIDGALTHVDATLASRDAGPAVYSTLTDLRRVRW